MFFTTQEKWIADLGRSIKTKKKSIAQKYGQSTTENNNEVLLLSTILQTLHTGEIWMFSYSALKWQAKILDIFTFYCPQLHFVK